MANLELPVKLTCMFVDYESIQSFQTEPEQTQGKHQTPHRTAQAGLKPRTFLL